jgi:hypothetical protein
VIPGLPMNSRDEQGFKQWLKRFVTQQTKPDKGAGLATGVRVYRTTNLLVASGAAFGGGTSIAWEASDTRRPDSTGMWTVIEPWYLKATRPGWYYAGASVLWEAGGATGARNLDMYLNRPAAGTQTLIHPVHYNPLPASTNTTQENAELVWLDVGDSIFWNAGQSTGAGINVLQGGVVGWPAGTSPSAFMFEVTPWLA